MFIPLPGSCPRGRTWGYRGGLRGQKKIFPKFNQIWCVSNLHQWHMQRHNFLGPNPLGPWGGAKRSNIIKSQSQSQFQRFLNQSLCVFSQLKDIKHIRRIFIPSPGSCPRGGTWGYRGGLGGPKTFFPKFNQIWCVSCLHEWHMQRHNFFRSPPPWALGRGKKVKYH